MKANVLAALLSALGLLVAIFVGAMVGEGSYAAIIAGVGGLLFFCGFALLGGDASAEAKLLAILIFGYTSFQRGFAEINFGRIVFVGEIGLALLLFFVLARVAFKHANPIPNHAITLPVILLLFLAASRFYLLDFRRFGLVLAARDLATVYYSLYYFIGFTIGQSQTSTELVRKSFYWGMIVYVPMIWILKIGAGFSGFCARSAALLGTRDMASIVPTVAGLFCVLYAFYDKRRLRLLAYAVFPLAHVIITNERSAYLACAVGLVLVTYVSARDGLTFMIRLGGGGILVAAALGFILLFSAYSHQSMLQPIVEKTTTIFDFDAFADSKTAVAGQTETHSTETNRWRTTWWRTIYDDVMATNPAFGLGFGYDLAARFLQEYYSNRYFGSWDTRGPHNILFTYLGRMGLVGAGLFCILVALIFTNLWRIAKAVRRRKQTPKQLEPWLIVFAIVMVAFFSHTLEGPMAAIPFWSFLGIGVAQQLEQEKAASARRAVIRRERHLVPAMAEG